MSYFSIRNDGTSYSVVTESGYAVADKLTANEALQKQDRLLELMSESAAIDRAQQCVRACAGIDDPETAIWEAREALRGLIVALEHNLIGGTENGLDAIDEAMQSSIQALTALGGPQ